MNESGQVLEALGRSEMFQRYKRAYNEATAMPLALRSVAAWQLPFRGQRNENAWCALMSNESPTCAACLQLQEKLSQGAMDGPTTLTCVYGLCETAVPVKLGRRTIGFLQTGQVFRQKPTGAAFKRALGTAAELGVKLESAAAKKAYFETPVVSQRKLDSFTGLLAEFADHLAVKSNQLSMQLANAEPPVITTAKQFIREHFTEDLSLGQVAGTVHISAFYFCKLFKRATGLTFTEFLSRLRTEKAKELLLNPNLRVSEIAYEVGFQSLTHFNRVFRRIAGLSPTNYRALLPGRRMTAGVQQETTADLGEPSRLSIPVATINE